MSEIPLVVYEGGERKVIGKAEVEEVDGALKARMTIDDPKIAAILNKHVVERMSFSPFRAE